MKKLFKVTYTYEFFVGAETVAEAKETMERMDWGGAEPKIGATAPVEQIRDIPPMWLNAQPYDLDFDDDRTCQERIRDSRKQ